VGGRGQLVALEPALRIEPLRGNIDTRLRKRGERGLDAVVLAACGLDRLGLGREIGRRFDPEELLPEAGQGALALQVRADEEYLAAAADDPETRRRVEDERATVATVGGGCLAPVAAHHDGVELRAAPPRRLAAVGPATAAALRAHGLEPDLVPRVASQEGLLAELPPGRVLLAAADGARRLLADERGADFLPLYRTIELAPETPPDGDVAL